jgi:epsilon-lactone hydrolase
MMPIHHSVSAADRATMADIREIAAQRKGVLERAGFDAIMEYTQPAEGVICEAATVGGIAGWWCRPPSQTPGTAILYLHGGAYIIGSPRAYCNLVGQIARRVQRAAFIPDYPLAPEHPFPAAVEGAKSAYAGLLGQGIEDVVLIGDSAGGGLALVLAAITAAAKARFRAPPTRVAVMSPWTDLALTGATVETLANADPFLTKAALALAAQQYLANHDARDPRASPLFGELRGLPPIRVDVGADEILLDDSRRYADRVVSAGGELQLHIWDSMPHVFAVNVGVLQAAGEALDHIASFLRGPAHAEL